MEANTQKAAAQLVIDLTERLHEAEAQVELLRGRLQSRRLSKVFRRTALSNKLLYKRPWLTEAKVVCSAHSTSAVGCSKS